MTRNAILVEGRFFVNAHVVVGQREHLPVEGFYTFNDFAFNALIQMTEIGRPEQNHREAARKLYGFTREIIFALIEVYQ